MNPYAYQTPAGLPARPVAVKRQRHDSAAPRRVVASWRVLGAKGWRMPTAREREALEASYGAPDDLLWPD